MTSPAANRNSYRKRQSDSTRVSLTQPGRGTGPPSSGRTESWGARVLLGTPRKARLPPEGAEGSHGSPGTGPGPHAGSCSAWGHAERRGFLPAVGHPPVAGSVPEATRAGGQEQPPASWAFQFHNVGLGGIFAVKVPRVGRSVAGHARVMSSRRQDPRPFTRVEWRGSRQCCLRHLTRSDRSSRGAHCVPAPLPSG